MFASTSYARASADRAPVRHVKMFRIEDEAPLGHLAGNMGLRSVYGNDELSGLPGEVGLVGSRNWDRSSEFYADVEGLVVTNLVVDGLFVHDDCGDLLIGSSNLDDDGLDFLNEKAKRRAAYQRESGRFGGYESCRRVRSNGDAEWDRFEKKAARQAIEDGLAEYYSGDFANSDERRNRHGKRGGVNRSRRALPPVATTSGADQFVEASRTGHVVAVTVKPTATSTREQRKQAMAGVTNSRLHLSSSELRRRMGLLDS